MEFQDFSGALEKLIGGGDTLKQPVNGSVLAMVKSEYLPPMKNTIGVYLANVMCMCMRKHSMCTESWHVLPSMLEN
jgi:hypothetical protein